MLKQTLIIFFFVVVFLVCPFKSWADTKPDRSQSHYWISNTFGVGINPPVLGDIFKFYKKIPLDFGENYLFSDSNLRGGLINTISPKFDKPGLMFGFSPMLILDLELAYQPILYWTTYEFHSYKDKYDDAARSHITPHYKTCQYFLASTQLRMKAGQVVMVDMFDAEYWSGTGYWFSDEIGTILSQGPAFHNKTFLLWEFQPEMRWFVDYELHHYTPSGYRKQIIGMGVYADKIFGHTGFFLEAGYHLENPDYHGIMILLGVLSEWRLK